MFIPALHDTAQHVIATGTTTDDGSGGGMLLIILIVGSFVYLAPTIVARFRGVPNVGSVAVINIALGWTLIGYVVAWAMALRSKPEPTQVVIQNQAPYGFYGSDQDHPPQGGPYQPGRRRG